MPAFGDLRRFVSWAASLCFVGTTTHLKNRGRVCGLRFGMAARREEREYPWWIFDRRATPPPRQRSATLRAVVRRAADCVAPQSQNPDGYAPSSRLVTGPPEHSAPIPY